METNSLSTPWFVVERTVTIIERGLLLVCGAGTSPEFAASDGDPVEIVRPNGSSAGRTRITEVCANPVKGCDDLIVDARAADVPPGSRLRVLRSGGRRSREGGAERRS